LIKIHIKKRLATENGPLDLEISLSLQRGEFFTLFGPSGAGKSTILRMLAGLTDPDQGKIEMNQKVWFDSEKKINFPPGKREVGLVFQDYALFPTMSIRKNLEYALPRRASAEEYRYVDELLHITGLHAIADRMPDSISGGQKQRVALARALVRKPALLLLDEPLSALDTEMRKKLQDLVLQLHQQSLVTTILVSHDIAEVFRVSDRVLLLDHGKAIKIGTPEDIFLEKNISGKFRFSGEVLTIQREDVVNIVSVLVGNSVVRVVAVDEEIQNTRPGDTVILISKAMNPMILPTSPNMSQKKQD